MTHDDEVEALMRVGVISGSDGYEWPGLTGTVPRTITTRYGRGHARLSNHLAHKAKADALAPAGIVYRFAS
ncbi:hypothetical protein KGA66_10840 [Actinocrinis puniceicyclus]|uniref:Uncharacterized protein n=1 Tax=Actinocrinis puniceicyclus TaxID=977794 RepID=A0A8J7WMK8_9ACTN|nr:hypothetical protein [Actinocrinis puniceicyclus]MBS2963545.1 hypothetical protein [Actinocrinis puniceicyclus]